MEKCEYGVEGGQCKNPARKYLVLVLSKCDDSDRIAVNLCGPQKLDMKPWDPKEKKMTKHTKEPNEWTRIQDSLRSHPLSRWIKHKNLCRSNDWPKPGQTFAACNCGLDDAIEKLSGVENPEQSVRALVEAARDVMDAIGTLRPESKRLAAALSHFPAIPAKEGDAQ